MKWIDAICAVLAENGGAMHYEDITQIILNKEYRTATATTENSVNSYLSTNPDLFKSLGQGYYELIDTSVTAHHSPKIKKRSLAAGTTGGGLPLVDVRPCTSYIQYDEKYKKVSDFVKSEDLGKLYDLEENLLELIVNFRLPLVNEDVCFVDILDKLKVEFSEKEERREQSIDADTLRKKLNEFEEQIAEIERELQNNPQLEELRALRNNMCAVAQEVKKLLGNASDGEVKFAYSILGEFISGDGESKPKVVIYLKSIEECIKSYERRDSVMAGVFVHEMFHAWNYFKAAGPRSVLAIDEPMVEFETLYFLQKLKDFTERHVHSLRGNVLCVRDFRGIRVEKKQQAIGDVAAYGFGYYLFEKLSESDSDSIQWIETYSKKSASIESSELVNNVEDALIPIYPFKSENKVMKWFKEIIFAKPTICGTVVKSAENSNTMNDVIYKIRVNRPCRLFIDEEEMMPLKENALTKIPLPKGEYLRKVVAEDDSTVFDEKVISLLHPKVDIIALDAIALEEAKRNALPDEIYQSNLYFKPNKDRLSVWVSGKREYVDAINIPDQIEYAGYVYPVTAVMLTAHDLKSITIPKSVKYIHFEGCSSLTSIAIPNSVTSIGHSAFEGCSSLTSIIIPDSVTSIYSNVFEGCDWLTAIDYVGTKKQWKKIMKHEFWKPLYKHLVIHCTDGDVEER